jgi:hypothetical protein
VRVDAALDSRQRWQSERIREAADALEAGSGWSDFTAVVNVF